VVAALCFAHVAWASAPLRVCLEADSPPFSSERGPDHGVDPAVALLVAEALQRPLSIHWFEASAEEDFPAPLQANWLLSRGHCHLVGGYPLLRNALGEAPIAQLQRAEGNSPAVSVKMSTLLASRPYLSLPLTLIASEGFESIDALDDVIGRRLAVERGSLADAIATAYGAARTQGQLQRLSFEGDAVFKRLESGAADVAFIERHRFDVYRVSRPTTQLRESDYQHPLGVNTGFAGIAPALLREVDRALRELMTKGRIASSVESAGIHYTSPLEPAILPQLTPRLLTWREAR
jgi:ABC-type amino acid transport substrate-binding protein